MSANIIINSMSNATLIVETLNEHKKWLKLKSLGSYGSIFYLEELINEVYKRDLIDEWIFLEKLLKSPKKNIFTQLDK